MTVADFCERVKNLQGKSYFSCDCIGVVTQALGIKCQGTNWLWRSIDNSSKYRFLVERSENLSKVQPGAVLFRIKWDVIPQGYINKPNCHHCGVLIDPETVIQSNPQPGVFSSKFNPAEWQAWGWMKQVQKPNENPSHDLPFDDPPLQIPDFSTMTDRDLLIAIYQKLYFND